MTAAPKTRARAAGAGLSQWERTIASAAYDACRLRCLAMVLLLSSFARSRGSPADVIVIRCQALAAPVAEERTLGVASATARDSLSEAFASVATLRALSAIGGSWVEVWSVFEQRTAGCLVLEQAEWALC